MAVDTGVSIAPDTDKDHEARETGGHGLGPQRATRSGRDPRVRICRDQHDRKERRFAATAATSLRR